MDEKSYCSELVSHEFLYFTDTLISSEEQQLERIMKRNNYTVEEAKQRINAQISLSEKCKWADFVIDNSTSLEYTREQVRDVYNTIKTISRHHGLYLWLFVAILGILLSILLLFI